MFKDGMLMHPFSFHKFFPQSPSNDFKVYSRHLFVANLHQVSTTLTQNPIVIILIKPVDDLL